MDSVYEETFNGNVLDETRYLDSLEARDSSSDSKYLQATDSSDEELNTQVEVYPVSREVHFPFTFDWNALFQPKRLHPRLEQMIYWRDPIKSGLIFITGFFILLAIDRFSIIFVVPFLLLHIMLASVACRTYRTVMRAATAATAATNNNNNDNISNINNNISEENKEPEIEWVEYEDLVVTLPREKVQLVTGLTVERINELIGHLKNLFLFKNPYDSMHFGLFLISLALLGKMINGTTMLLLIFIFVFTIPKLYELHKPSIDAKFVSMRKHLTLMANKFRVVISNEI